MKVLNSRLYHLLSSWKQALASLYGGARSHVKFSILILNLLALGCVGTIEDSKLEKTKTATSKVEKLPFAGLVSATPVSHDKVEVAFAPVNGDPANITYEIFVNNSETPIFVSGSSLTPNPAGLLVYSVGGLQVNTNYTFSVSATNNETGAESDEGDSLSAKTFANITADFAGIANLRLPAGIAGFNSVIVEWVAAKSTGSTFSPKNADPVAYEIIAVDDNGGADALNDPNYSGQRIVSIIPNPIPANPTLSSEISRVIGGLTPNSKYFFQVRAIHKGYVLYGGPTGDPLYKKELNEKFLAITTRSPTGAFDFEPTSAKVKSPDGEAALTALDVLWTPAEGDFDHYRIFKYEINSIPYTTEPDQLSTAQINVLNGSPLNYIRVEADGNFVRLTNLVSYKYYQVKVVCCSTAACEETKRIESVLVTAPTFPKIAPFDGIDHIDHPRDVATTDTVHAIFNSPVISSGYLTGMKLYCYNGATDPAPAELYALNTTINGAHLASATVLNVGDVRPDMPATGNVIINGSIIRSYTAINSALETITLSAAIGSAMAGGEDVNYHVVGKPSCTGLYRMTDSPTSQTSFASFEEIDIRGVSPGSGTQHCFSAVPVIDGVNTHGYTDFEDLSSAIVKCVTPIIKTPTLVQFPGKDPVCSVSGRKITVDWDLPTGGMYNKFSVYWKRKDGTPFRFDEAVAGHPSYKSVTNLASTATSQVIDFPTVGADGLLIPGERYYTAVIAYLEVLAPVFAIYYSEYNLNTNDCLVPLPTAEFQMWTEIFAVGPKVDGLVPPDSATGKRTTLFETLDDSTTPVEVLMDPADVQGDAINSDANTGFYLERGQSGGYLFDGVFGAKDGDPATFDRLAISNSGIIRISFRDAKFYSGALSMNNLIADYEGGSCTNVAYTTFHDCLQNAETWTPLKKNMKYGYKIYRSGDGKLTWTDLTSSGSSTFQTANNSGPVRARDVSYRKRNNATPTTESWVTFTDYSVKYSHPYGDGDALNDDVERARVYYYKIVPLFNGTPLTWSNTENMLKVTLPPPNMALVHRKMANRTICNEMNKTVDLTPGKHYTCSYNGLGASGLSFPWEVGTGSGKTVYDIGGDLLVDRFELGCNMTRGDNLYPSRSDYPPSQLDSFQGQTDDFMNGSPGGANFKGCIGREDSPEDDDEYEPLNADYLFADEPLPGSIPTDQSFRRVRQGDCFGKNGVSMSFYQCAGDVESKTQKYLHVFPGSVGRIQNCTNANNTYYGVDNGTVGSTNDAANYRQGGISNDGYDFQTYLTQSEVAAVYFHRGGANGAYGQREFPAGSGGQFQTQGSRYPGTCYMNLPFVNNGYGGSPLSGVWTSRWFGNSKLMDAELLYVPTSGPNQSLTNLYSKTVTDILNDLRFYDNAAVAKPTFAATTRFNKDTTPLAKIISSNNAKLPPLGNLAQIDIYRMCQQYKVELGTVNDTTNVFYQLETPAKKRIMTKKEFNVIAAWPELDSSATSGNPAVNTYNQTMVTNIEAGAYNHARVQKVAGAPVFDDSQGCNNSNKLANGVYFQWDYPIDVRFPSTGANTNPYLLTGSSAVDTGGLDVSTGKCVSKFGIQDLVGNMMETVAEQFWCDFTGDKMYLGPAGGGNQANSIAVEVSNTGSGPDTSGYVNGVGGDYVGGNRQLQGTLYESGVLAPWVLPAPNTGQCSTVSDGATRNGSGSGTGYGYQYVDGTTMLSIYDPVLTYNPLVIHRQRTFAQELVLDSRVGDGYFWDFGQNNLMQPIAENDSMLLKSVGANHLSFYFNPALGFPVRCSGATSCSDSGDNKKYTTTNFNLWHAEVSGETNDIENFPVNNGEIYNDGLQGIYSYTYISSPNSYGSNFDYITSVNPGADLNAETGAHDDVYTWDNADGLTDIVSGVRSSWTVSRSHPMYMIVGGDVNVADTGRYYAHLQGNSPDTQRQLDERGGRCIIKINMND